MLKSKVQKMNEKKHVNIQNWYMYVYVNGWEYTHL